MAEENSVRKPKFRFDGTPLEIKPWVSWLVVLTSVLLCAVGSYISFMYFSDPPATNPGLHQIVLDKLRETPSNQSWMTVEESLEKEVEKSQKEGRLVEAEGWDVRQIADGSFNIAFTYQEKDNKQQIALWNVNLTANRFIPKTDLAEFILKTAPASQ